MSEGAGLTVVWLGSRLWTLGADMGPQGPASGALLNTKATEDPTDIGLISTSVREKEMVKEKLDLEFGLHFPSFV